MDQLVPLVSGNATLVSATPIELMCASLCQYPDGDSEVVTIDPTFHQPILQYLSLSAPEYPTTACFVGVAPVTIYQQALRSLRYTNTKGSPTPGQRVAIVSVYNGRATNSVPAAYALLSVSIRNAPPTVSVSSSSTNGFYNTFFPYWSPVPAISPTSANVVDTDSVTIAMATITIQNALDGESELLAATYISPERVSLPVVEQALDLNLPVGRLWKGGSAPTITSTITISQGGYVGDVSIVVDIRHSRIGDLTLQLEHLGYIDLLVMSPGGHTCSQDDMRGVVFSSNTSSNVFLSRGYRSPGLCTFMSQGLFTPDGDLSRFRGLYMTGNWTLSITDQVVSVDTGRLVAWALVIQPKEDHLVWAWPPVVPPLAVYPGDHSPSAYHQRMVESDGRLTDLAIQVHLSVPFGAIGLYGPTLTLVHPDGTSVLLFNGSVPLCAVGNYTYIIFRDDAPRSCDFTCFSNTSLYGSGSGSGSGQCEGDALGLIKPGLVDLMRPATPLSSLVGKLAGGRWVLRISPSGVAPSRLLGWSMRVAREPNVHTSYNRSSQQLVITGADSPLNYQRVLQGVVYKNTATPNINFSIPRHIVTTVMDGQGAYSNSSSPSSSSYLTIHHIDLTLDLLATTWIGSLTHNVSFVENQPPLAVFNSRVPVLGDLVYQRRNYTLFVTLRGYRDTRVEGITLNTSVISNMRVINTSDLVAMEYRLVATSIGLVSIANVQTLLSTLSYFNDAVVFSGAGREVDIVITDTTDGNLFTSGVGVVNIGFIYVDHPPVLILNSHIAQTDTISNVLGYTEGDPPLPLANPTGLVLIDVDNTTLVSIEVSILDPVDGMEEVLAANASGTNISSSYNTSTNILLLVGVASLDQYRAVLLTVSYDNLNSNPGNPGTTPRRISFIPFDGIRYGNASIAYVLFTAVNNPPFGDLNGVGVGENTTASYTERDPPVPLCPTAAIFDVDNLTLASIEVRILNNLDQSQEVLASGLGQTHFDPRMGLLTITGLPSVAAFQAALRNVTYINYADEPNTTPRTIEVVMEDGLAFSWPLYVTVNITLVNDAPHFNSSAPPFKPSMLEDESPSTNNGWAVSEMSYLIEDSDAGAVRGVAIVGYDVPLGVLQYSLNDGTNWTSISPAISLNRSLLLSDEPAHRIRFIPITFYNGPVNISVVAWDRTDGLASRSYSDAHHTSLASPYSTQTLTITLTVIPVNNAPVLQGVPLWLTSIKEDNMTSSGDPVANLLLYATDPDHPPVFGVAILSADQTNGTWQYTTDGGKVWYAFGAVKPSLALLLQGVPGTLVRFVPKMYFTGNVLFQFKAWDLTTFYEDYGSGFGSGSGAVFVTNGSSPLNGSSSSLSSYPSGTLVDTLLSDPINGPFSVNTTNASIYVVHVNHSPLVYPGMSLSPILEATPPDMNHGTTVASIIKFYTFYFDHDANSDSGLAVVGVDNRYGDWQYSCGGTLNWTSFVGDWYYGYQIPLLPILKKATLLLSTCSIRFLPFLYFNTQADRNGNPWQLSVMPYITVLGWDNTGLSAGRSGSYGNDASSYGSSSSVEFSSTMVRATITVVSVDNVPILLLNNSLSPNYQTTFYEDQPPVAIVGGGVTLIDHDNATLKDLTITIRGGSFDQSPFSSLVFQNTTASYGTGVSSSPVYPSLQEVTDYVGNLSTPSPLELYCAGLTSRREALLITTAGTDLTSEVLSWCPFSVRIYGRNNTLVSKEQFQYLLTLALYNNSIDPVTPGDRTLTFVVSDGLGLSVAVNTTITVVFVDGAPVLDLNTREPDFNNHVFYVEGDVNLPLTNETGLVLYDTDNSTLLYARVVLLDHPDGDYEILHANTTGTNISDSYILANHTLSLYGNASVQDYARVLRTVSYTNTFSNPGNPSTIQRRVLFVASDGVRESAPVYSYISFTAVNNAPWIDANGNDYGMNHQAVFTEERGPVSIFDQTGYVMDIDNLTLSSVLVRIVNPYDSTLEYLQANPILVYYHYLSNRQVVMATSVINVTGNVRYDASTFTLRISGLPSLEQFNMVLRTVQYNNLKHKIHLRNRSIQFVANDGLLNSTAVYTNVTMVPVNHAPYFTNYSVITPLILEDQVDSPGFTVHDIITGRDSYPYPGLIGDDDDVHSISDKGIAVIAVDNSQGVWQYKVLANSTFFMLFPSNVTISSALVLRGTQFRELFNYIRFVPNPFFNGNASMTFLAWDTYYPLPDGTTKDTTTPDLESPFSLIPRTLWVVVVPVNNAPTINTSVVVTMTPIYEGATYPPGDDVTLFLAALQGDIDVRVISLQSFGIAVVSADTSNGAWQYSTNGGRNWTVMTTPTITMATVLTSTPSQQQRVRFVPQRYFYGTASISYVVWDQNTSYPSGSVVSTLPPSGVDPNTFTFSLQSTTATITVIHVNNAPVIAGNAQVFPIMEDVPILMNLGKVVSVVIGSSGLSYYDVDPGALMGIAVVGVDRRYGNWQYTCGSGSQKVWYLFVGGYIQGVAAPADPSDQYATLLDSSCWIRFIPQANFNTQFDQNGNPRNASDTPYLKIRGWDLTYGWAGQVGVNTSYDPLYNSGAFSRNVSYVYQTVVSVNDAPVLWPSAQSSSYSTVYTEPLPLARVVRPVSLVNTSSFSLSDVDNSTLAWINISFTLRDGSAEAILGSTAGTTLKMITVATNTAYTVQILPLVGTSAPLGNFAAVLRTLQYQNTMKKPSTITRVITFLVSDGFFPSPSSATIMVTVVQVDDPPELDLNANMPDIYNVYYYREGQGPAHIVDPSVTLVVYNAPLVVNTTVTILYAPDGDKEVLAANTTSTNITATYVGSTLFLRGPATPSDFRKVITTVTYTDLCCTNDNTHSYTPPSPLTRTIEFVVNDGINSSVPANVYLYLNPVDVPPFLDLSGNTTGVSSMAIFYDQLGPISVVARDAILYDVDNVTLAYVEVTILNPLDGPLESLWVEPVSMPYQVSRSVMGVVTYTPTQSYNSTTSSLLITGLDTVPQYELILRTLRYNNLAPIPRNATRVLSVVASDGLLETTVNASIVMVILNDAPYFNTSAILYRPVVAENTPTTINVGWSIEDLTSWYLLLDDNVDNSLGIGIVGLDTRHGQWEYTTDFTFITNITSTNTTLTNTTSTNTTLTNTTAIDNNDTLWSGSGMYDVPTSPTLNDTTSTGSVPTSPTLNDTTSTSQNISAGVVKTCSKYSPPSIPADPLSTFSAHWLPLPAMTSITKATLLKVNGSFTRLRFLPNKYFNGLTSFTIVIWDGTDNRPSGSVANATYVTQMGSFSSSAFTLNVSVTHVNNAPFLSNTTTFTLTPLLENHVPPLGDDVASLVTSITDVDGGAPYGIAIIQVDSSNGTWQFSTNGGTSWSNLTGVCPQNATLLSSSPPNQNRLRFVPNTYFFGNVSLWFLGWDRMSGELSGTQGVDTTMADPLHGPFSTSQTSATITVIHVNNAPFLAPGGKLTPIAEDTPTSSNNGTAVVDIVAGVYLDVDPGAEVGVAVVGVDLRFGAWQWWCPQSQTWQTFVGDIYYGVVVPKNPLVEKATLLEGDCRIRFLPNLNFNSQKDNRGFYRPLSDQPYISILGWDNTGATRGKSGWYGIDASYYNRSAIDEFSGVVRSAMLEVISVDDPTVVRISGQGNGTYLSVEYTQLSPYTRIVEPQAVSLTDLDNAYLASITVILLNPIDIATESVWLLNSSAVTLVNDTLAMVSISGRQETVLLERYTFINESGEPTSYLHMHSDSSSNVTIEAFQALLMQVVYSNVAMEPDNSTRHITFEVDDGILVTTVQTDVRILLFDAYDPVLTNNLTSFPFTEGQASPVPLVSPLLTLSDLDNNLYFFMANLTISLSPIPASPFENVSVDTSAHPSFTQTYDPRRGVLVVSGEAPVSSYQSILRSALYHNTADKPEPGLRTASIQVTDLGGHGSNVVKVVVNVSVINNHAPFVTTPNSTFVYVQHSPPVNISRGVIFFDADSRYFPAVSVSVTITDALDGEEETLDVIPVGTISVTYVNDTLLLTGPAPVVDFQRTIATLTYVNTAVVPRPNTRHISMVMYDGIFTSNASSSLLVSIQLVNYPPVVNLMGPFNMSDNIVNYFEGEEPVALALTATITDLDNSTLVGLVARLKYPYDRPLELLSIGEYLVVYDNGTEVFDISGVFPNITVTYDNATGVLTASGEAPIGVYEQLLRNLTYDDLYGNPGNPNTSVREVEVEVFDGINGSLAHIITITFASVNDAPMLDLNGPRNVGYDFSTTFVENGLPVNITSPDMILFDIDNTTLASVTVTIENSVDSGERLLSPYGLHSNIQYENGNTTLVISGLTSIVDFHAIVVGISYLDPVYVMGSYADRVISFVANDGLLNSPIRYTTVHITHVNHPPVLTISGIRPAPLATPTSSLTHSSTPVSFYSSTPTLSPTPLDGSGSGSGSGFGFDAGNVSSSGPTSSPTSQLIPTPSPSPPPTPSSPSTGPEVYNDTFVPGPNYFTTYHENATPIPIVDRNSVTVSDPDVNDTTLYLLEVVLEGAEDGPYEGIFVNIPELSRIDHNLLMIVSDTFRNLISVTGDGSDVTFSSNTSVVLEFQIMLPPSDWVNVIRSLRYCNRDKNMTTGNRTVSFRIKDLPDNGNWSNTVYTTIEGFSVNNPPVYSPPENYTANYTIYEDQNLTFNALQYFFDYDNILTGAAIQLYTLPDHGLVVIDNATGNITYLTALHDNGIRNFTYHACDPLGACSDPINVTISILFVNYPPYPAQPLEAGTLEDTPIIINVSYYFADVEVPLPWAMDVAPSAGDWHFVDPNDPRLIYYKPPLYQHGNFSINMTVCDYIVCIPFTIVIMVTRINYPPTITVDPLYVIAEGRSLDTTIAVSDVESRGRGDLDLRYTSVTHGTVNVSYVSGDLVNNILVQIWHLVYTPDMYYNGSASVSLLATDSESGTVTATVNVLISYVNFPPSFGTVNLTAYEDTPLVLPLPQGLNITDPNDPVYPDLFSIVQGASIGNVSYSKGVLRYMAPLHYFSSSPCHPITFIMRACDNNSIDVPKCQEATIFICVAFLNHLPTFSPAVMSVLEDQTFFTSLNLSATLSDVEDKYGLPLNGTQVVATPTNGLAFYDNRTGNVSYKPNPAFYGIDYIIVLACDSNKGCSLGNVTVVVQNVNRPPVVANFTHYSSEDDFDLVALYDHTSDSETPPDSILGTLLFSIANTSTGAYSSLGTTSMGGALRVYNTHGIATYAPPTGFVGVDTFTYSVCDPCDPTWASQLGQPLPLNCTLQQQRVGPTRARIACSVATVTIYVVGVDHLPTLQTLSAIVLSGQSHTFTPFNDSAVLNGGRYWYSNQSAPIFDRKDLQTLIAIQKNLNLTLFNLRNSSSIDEHSLTLVTTPTRGVAMVTSPYGRGIITYTPITSFSGYEQFNYRVCSLAYGSAQAKCSVASVQIFVSKPAPKIVAVSATSGGAADTMISKGDQILITFDEATSMPPQNTTSHILNTSEVDLVFTFATPFINTSLVTDAYSGVWLSPTKFQIMITDEGYPQPFSSALQREVATGVWTVSTNQNRGPCSKLTSQSPDPYCLLSADATSLQASTVSPPLTGNFGTSLPRVTFVVVRNDLVDASVVQTNADVLLFQGTRLVVLLQQALSYYQLSQLCAVQTIDLLDLSPLDPHIQLEIDGCSNYLPNGTDANELYAYQISVMAGVTSSAGTTGKRSSDDITVSRSKRSLSTPTTGYVEPITSEMVFRVSTLTRPTVSDVTVLSGAVQAGFNLDTLVSVVSQTTGVANLQTPTSSTFQVLVEGDDDITPLIMGVVAGNPLKDSMFGNGNTVTISFDSLTNTPTVATKADLDKILTITPSLGKDYRGRWLDGRTLQITVVDSSRPSSSIPVPKSTSCSLTFTLNYDTGQKLISAYLGSTPARCLGVHLCDPSGVTVGICSQNRLSCRVNQSVTGFEGSFDSVTSTLSGTETTSLPSYGAVIIAIFCVVAIAIILVVVFFCYRQYKLKSQRKEALRVVQRWKKDNFAPGKAVKKEEGEAKAWSKPPDTHTMRTVVDPFMEEPKTIRPGDSAGMRPATAAPDVENLPPLPQQRLFLPRSQPRIPTVLPNLQSIPDQMPRTRTIPQPPPVVLVRITNSSN